jgi:peptidoglycan/LPS O-acetylase OafA/YrhL
MSSMDAPNRAIQLDGLRALAMLGICWDHWVPEAWGFGLPYEAGLYFFLVLSGYLITGSLLRTRDKQETSGKGWRWRAWKDFQWRRGLRIMLPYYVALVVALGFLAPKIGYHIHWYLLYLTNIHIALLGEWPHGTSHFWSIAIQQQFYLFWPAVVWLAPRRLLIPTMILFVAIAPLSRYFDYIFMPPFIWPHKLSWGWFDFFGIGGLMALAVHRGFPLSAGLWKILMVAGCGAYAVFEFGPRFGLPPNRIGPFYPTILTIGLCGVIATASLGWNNLAGRFLETRFLQRVGLLSYGIYLYHNLAPIILGKIAFFLWPESNPDHPALVCIRIALYAALTWCMTMASWKYIETPLNRMRARKP